MDVHSMLAWTLRISEALNDIIRNLRFAIVYAKKFGQLCWRIRGWECPSLAATIMPIMGLWAEELPLNNMLWSVERQRNSCYRGPDQTGLLLLPWYSCGRGSGILVHDWLWGLWYGLLVAQIVRALFILFAVLKTDWEFEELRAHQLVGGYAYGKLQMASSNFLDADEEKGFLSTRQMCNPCCKP